MEIEMIDIGSCETLLKCRVCYEELSDPRILPCIHTFCMECLVKEGYGKKPGEGIGCPVCRREFEIPADGIGGIPRNYFVQKLLHVSKLLLTKNAACEFCSENIPEDREIYLKSPRGKPRKNPRKILQKTHQKIPQAVTYCIECEQQLCQRCREAHGKVKTAKDHNFVDSNDTLIKKSDFINMTRRFCDRHLEEPQSIYCEDCELPVCFLCFAEDHKSHKCSKIQDLTARYREQLKELMNRSMFDNLKKCREQISKTVMQQKNNVLSEIARAEHGIQLRATNIKKTVQLRREKLEKTIDEHAKLMKTIDEHAKLMKTIDEQAKLMKMNNELAKFMKIIDAHTGILLIDLDFIKSKRFEEINKIKDDFEKHVETLEYFERYVNEMISKGSFDEMRQTFDDLSGRVAELQDHPDFIYDRVIVDRILFSESRLGERWNVKGSSNIVGKVVGNRQIRNRIEAGGMFVGITYLEDRVYCIAEKSNIVRVFKSQPPCDRIDSNDVIIPDLGNPHDICASSVSRSLFIGDSDRKCVWRITFPEGSITEKILAFSQVNISLNFKNELLVLCSSKPRTVHGDQAEERKGQKPEQVDGNNSKNRKGQKKSVEPDNRDDQPVWILQVHNTSDKLEQIHSPITLPASFHAPIRAVQSLRGTFFILFEKNESNLNTNQCVEKKPVLGPYLIGEISRSGTILQIINRDFFNPNCFGVNEIDLLYVHERGANFAVVVDHRTLRIADMRLCGERDSTLAVVTYVKDRKQLVHVSESKKQ